jgi:hypothetical protein
MMQTMNDYGFIDIHYHASPDLYQRRWTAIEAGQHYQALGGAVVLKNHLGSTSIQATLLQKLGLPVFPSLVLNASAGGIHTDVILHALAEYQPTIPSKLLVHFPTITGRTYRSLLQRNLVHEHLKEYTQKAATVSDAKGKLRQEVIDILKMSSDFPIVLSTGHASKEEVFALVEACETYNVPQLLLNQPANPLTGLKADDLLWLTQQKSVFVEQTALTYLLGHQSKEDFEQVLKEVPRVIYSSDLGQTSQMDIADWYRVSETYFKQFLLSNKRQNEIKRDNAYNLLFGKEFFVEQ